MIFVAGAIVINYALDLEDGIIDVLPRLHQRLISFVLLYFVGYVAVLSLNRVFIKTETPVMAYPVLLKAFFGVFLLSFDTAFHFGPYIAGTVPIQLNFYTLKVLNNVIPFLTYALPLYILYKVYDSKEMSSYYGVTREGFVPKPYLQLFMLVIPLVVIASFHENFNSYYPNYKSTGAAAYLGIPEWVTVAIYEVAYGSSFFTVELLFRGFFVMGMVQLLGRHAILPMATVYCFIHFGKPMGECISAFFGGYFLGVVAYYSKNIWGGVIIHLGLAWLMEIAAFLQHLRLDE